MQICPIEPLESRIAPATVLTSAVFTSESTVISGTYDGGVDGTIEIFVKAIGGTPTSIGTLGYFAADGPAFTANAPVLPVGSSISAAVTPNGGVADAFANPIGATRGIWVEDIQVLEGGNSHTANFTIRLSLPSASPVSVQYATVADSAVAGQDFTAANGSVTFAPGETSKTVPVTILGDAVKEAGGELFGLRLSGAAGAVIADDLAVATIVDDDASSGAAVGVYVVPISVSEANATATVELRLTRAAGASVSVAFNTADGTGSAAIVGSDYSAASGTVTFPAGRTTQTITIPILGDAIAEGREHFRVALSAPSSGLEILTPVGDVAILDNDLEAGPVVTIADVSIAEGTSNSATAFTFTVALSSPATEQVTLRVATGEGTARLTDFQGGTGTLTIDIGESSGSIDVPVRADNFFETNESFFFAIDQILGAVPGDTFAVATINNDDSGLPVIEISDASVTETDAAGVSAVFTVTLSVAAATNVTVNLATGLGSALPGIDYGAVNGTLTFLPGETVKNVSIAIGGDLAYETTEVFGVSLTNAVGATIGDNLGVGTIFDNDPVNTGVPHLQILDRQVIEGTGTSQTSTIVVALDHAAPAPITVQLRYRDGTAVIGSDISNPTISINIPAGADSGSATFTVAADFALETNEYFYVDVLSATASVITDNRAVVTIVNDDAGPEISEDQKTAKWRDVDGDFITLTASKGILTTANFAMLPVNGGLLLGALFLQDAAASGMSVSISAKGPGNSINMGAILAGGVDLGSVKVQGDISRIVAGSGGNAVAVAKLDIASIGANGAANDIEGSRLSEISGRLGSVFVRGNIGDAVLMIDSGIAPSIGSLKVGGKLQGGTGDASGYLFATGDIGSIDIRGGIVGGGGFYSGAIQTLGNIGKVNIGADIKGGAGVRSGAIFAHGFHPSSALGIGSIAIKGSLIGGAGTGAGAIYSFGAIGSMKVGIDIAGAFIAAGGIAQLAVGRSVLGSQIVSGIAIAGTGFANTTSSSAPVAHATAGFGKITVGGNWSASSLVADISPGLDGFYGTGDDASLYANTIAAIQSVKIKGTISGTPTAGDAFGFLARTIVAFRAANASPLLNLATIDGQIVPGTNDVAIRELIPTV